MEEKKLRLKKIEILGFKSFADKTVLQFHPGITGIVGPNGCGKSNISDAFRWVLGEQSAKSMRGNKMNDVIFAGTTKRKPVNLAEVIITLEGNGGLLPTQYDEIAVGRRLYRSGESEYILNRSSVRLKDIQDLFLDSGMGKNAFSIFEQGKLDQVINFSPLERRFIFEEAAGISRFLQRKREALRRLEQTEQNLSRILDIHQEVKRQILVLEEQAKKATLYKENRAKFEMLDIAVLIAKWDDFQKKWEELEAAGNAKKGKVQSFEKQIQDLEKERHIALANFADSQKSLEKQREAVYKLKGDLEVQTQELKHIQENMKERVSKEQQWTQTLSGLSEQRKLRRVESGQILTQQHEVEKNLVELETLRKEIRKMLSDAEGEAAILRNKQKEAQREQVQLVALERQAENDARQALFRLEHTQERKSRLKESKELLERRAGELASEIEKKRISIEEKMQDQSLQKEKYRALEQEIQETSKMIKEAQAQLNSIYKERTEHRARRQVLLRLREEMEGFSAATKKLLQEAANPSSPLYQKITGLYQSLSPEPGAEKAVAAVLKSYMQTLVVSSKQDLDLLLQFAQENNLKDFSVICLEDIVEKDKEATLISSIHALVADNKLARHFLSGAYFIENLPEGMQVVKKYAGATAVTKQNICIDPKQVVFIPAEGESNVFLQEAEINILFEKLQQLDRQSQKLEEDIKAAGQIGSRLQAEKIIVDQAIRQNEVKLAEEKFAHQRFQSDLEKVKKDLEIQENEALSLDTLGSQLQSTIVEIKHKHAAAKAKVEESLKTIELFNDELEKKSEKLKIEQQSVQEKERAFHKVMEEKRKFVHQLNLLEVKDLESLQQEKRLEEELKSLQENHTLLHQRNVDGEKKAVALKLQLEAALQSASEYEGLVLQKKEVIGKIENSISIQRETLKVEEGELNILSIESAKIGSGVQAIETEMRERYQYWIADARAKGYQLEGSLEKSERILRALRRELETAGDINMTSIEEFEQHKTRYDFLSKQIEDLTVSKQELVQIITELDTESRKLFKETFDKVRENFKKNFTILFTGGEADIEFTETADVLEAGIDIAAKPPGKQMRSINLLSGGEKCLTALALLFAIFEVKPAPFCILDEIDAPLDDTNVERFLNVVKQFTHSCQFIIITHNKRTMAIADVLFGITMQEKGVSNILSMEFEKSPVPALV